MAVLLRSSLLCFSFKGGATILSLRHPFAPILVALAPTTSQPSFTALSSFTCANFPSALQQGEAMHEDPQSLTILKAFINAWSRQKISDTWGQYYLMCSGNYGKIQCIGDYVKIQSIPFAALSRSTILAEYVSNIFVNYFANNYKHLDAWHIFFRTHPIF